MNRTGATKHQAEVAIRFYKYCNKKADECVCPECETKLEMEYGSYEEGYDDYVYCDECDFSDSFKEKYHPMSGWYCVDVALMSADQHGEEGIDEYIISWVEKQTQEWLEIMNE